MIPELHKALNPKGYDDLPEPIRATLTAKEWLWLSDAEKASLTQTITEPESFDD